MGCAVRAVLTRAHLRMPDTNRHSDSRLLIHPAHVHSKGHGAAEGEQEWEASSCLLESPFHLVLLQGAKAQGHISSQTYWPYMTLSLCIRC